MLDERAVPDTDFRAIHGRQQDARRQAETVIITLKRNSGSTDSRQPNLQILDLCADTDR